MIKGEYMWIFNKNEKILMKVKKSQNRLYKLIIETKDSKCLITKVDQMSRLWHSRMGHVNYQALSLMFKERMVRGLPKITKTHEACIGCLMGKQTRKGVPGY